MTDRRRADAAKPRDMVDLLPDLATAVGLAGIPHRAEVGGNVCFNTVIGIAIIVGK